MAIGAAGKEGPESAGTGLGSAPGRGLTSGLTFDSTKTRSFFLSIGGGGIPAND